MVATGPRDAIERASPQPQCVMTMAEHPTTSWQAMQDGSVFYRQQRLYTLDGKLPSLGDCVVAGCRNGGPLGACNHTLPCHHKEV
jgi:hypothetical protein